MKYLAHPIPWIVVVLSVLTVLWEAIGAPISLITQIAIYMLYGAGVNLLVGYTGLCPRVYQSGACDRRGPLAKNGPAHLRWALIEAAVHAARHPAYAAHYEVTKNRLGRQRGPRSPASRSRASSARRSGTCSPAQRRLPRQVPHRLWSRRRPCTEMDRPSKLPSNLILPKRRP